jgi:hypothetical protein
LGFIIPTDFQSIIFQRGRSTTNQIIYKSWGWIKIPRCKSINLREKKLWRSQLPHLAIGTEGVGCTSVTHFNKAPEENVVLVRQAVGWVDTYGSFGG